MESRAPRLATEHVARAPRLCYRACATELMETRASVRTRTETSIKHSMSAAEKSLSLGVLLSPACDGCRQPVVVVVVAWLRMVCLPWLSMIAAFASYACLPWLVIACLPWFSILGLLCWSYVFRLSSYAYRLGSYACCLGCHVCRLPS